MYRTVLCGGVCTWYMVGRLVYTGGMMVLGETVTRSFPFFPSSSDVMQHESPSKDHHEFCLPRLTAQCLSRPKVTITLAGIRRNSVGSGQRFERSWSHKDGGNPGS